MQDLLLHLLQENDAISRKVHELAHRSPSYQKALQEYNAVARQVQDVLGYDLLDAYEAAFNRCSCYESAAYYALGLGLREELVKLWIER